MAGNSLLEGKKVLVVDDEPDVLETLKELLPMCHVEGAGSFKKAKELLETQHFDMAILDILGVDGYRLLKVANSRNVIAVMFTAHALSPVTCAVLNHLFDFHFSIGHFFYQTKVQTHMIARLNPIQLSIGSAYHCIPNIIAVKITDHFEAFERKSLQRFFGSIEVRLI